MGCDPVRKIVQFALHPEQFREGAADLFVERARGEKFGFLTEVADLNALGPGDRAQVRLELTGDQAEEGRLARAVGTNQPDRFTRVKLQRDVAQHDLRAELLGDTLYRYSSHGVMLQKAADLRYDPTP